jgi:hypothetical protein
LDEGKGLGMRGEGAASVGGDPFNKAPRREDLGVAAGGVEVAFEGALAQDGAGDFALAIEDGSYDGGMEAGMPEIEEGGLIGTLEEFFFVEDAGLVGEMGLDKGGHGAGDRVAGFDGM